MTWSDLEHGIRTAMRQRRLVEFWAKGLRRVGELRLYGVQAGNHQVLLYQLEGETRSDRLPGWRRVKVNDISGFRILERSFAQARSAPASRPNWDVVIETSWDDSPWGG
jgi:hypothetical protein